MVDTVLQIKQINLKLLEELLWQLDTSIKACNYQQVIDDASTVIDQLCQSHLLVLLDIRAYAHAKQGHYDSACIDAQKMIDYAPKLGVGYARKGDVFSMFGRQSRAIDTYNQGLEAAALDHTQIQRLAKGKMNATMQSQARVDFLAALPTELGDSIIQMLSREGKAACLSVSRVWRARTLGCSAAWTDLVIDGCHENMQLVSVMPYIGQHILVLEINTENKQLRSDCLQHMANNHFHKMRSLKLTAPATSGFIQYFGRTTVALWQVRKTLTSLSVDLGENRNAITLADILLSCCRLTDLCYTTTSSMATLVGEFSTMEKHSALSFLKLESSSITGENIKTVLQRCQSLRALVMQGSDQTVFDPVMDYAPNLEILAYNAINQVIKLDGSTRAQPRGLRKRTLCGALFKVSGLSKQIVQRFYTAYPNFKFKNLSHLALCSNRWTQSFIIRSIRNTTTLKYLNIIGISDLHELVDTLMIIPPVVALGISHIYTTGAGTSLIQLFDRYAAIPPPFGTDRVLGSISFQNSPQITDPVLASMAKVRSLNQISLRCLTSVTALGLSNLLEALKLQLVHLELAEMDVITDSLVTALSQHSMLSTVILKGLPHVTNQGIQEMVLKKIPDVCGLSQLKVIGCSSVTEESISYAKQHVETVVYE
ncbi:hypothetical protein BJV82DRAFT_42922 [Fennellomyces sp. T-0311]|nr:hypothetical protein BJV82DRAFT_42922 [Fennellomyces sp. T-0311]